ncbi:hypothetical protein KLJ63_01405 [Vibrio splendidus]|nr:hypothetical protein KLJ63_01405 [Vibrio splendidus]
MRDSSERDAKSLRAQEQIRDASERDAKSLRADESSEIRVNEEIRAGSNLDCSIPLFPGSSYLATRYPNLSFLALRIPPTRHPNLSFLALRIPFTRYPHLSFLALRIPSTRHPNLSFLALRIPITRYSFTSICFRSI